MRTVEKFPRSVRELENVWIELSDGCRLAARIWLPEDAETSPVPAILEYLPYRKRDGTAARDALTHPYLAGHGYACVRVDMRGNGESDGLMEDEYLPQEQDDALQVIAWLAAQPWCSGAVGMMGISWGGFNALQVAARRPPALKAIVTVCSTVDRYADDIHYKGGCLLGENLGWAATMLAYSSRPPDPLLVGERWREMWLHRLENEPVLIDTWLRHQTRDAYWRHGSVCEDYGAIQAATLAVGGWNDSYKNAVPQLVQHLRVPVKGIVGPWIHKYPHFAVPGPRIGFLQEMLRWWDRWLKGSDTGVERDPAYRIYLMASELPQAELAFRQGRWIGEPAWPSPNVSLQRLWLNDDGLCRKPGALVPRAVCSPQDLGLTGGEFCAIWTGPELPLDQRADDGGSLCFDSRPLQESVAIVGAPVVELEIAADRRVAFVVVRLCDVFPDGTSARITYGVLNLCQRESRERPSPLEPGRRYRVRVELDHIAYELPAGHRLRVAISSTYWPLLWPSPEPVTLTVTAGTSHLELPVRKAPGSEPEVVFAGPEAAPPRAVEQIRPPSHDRRVERDLGTGETRLVVDDDFGLVKDLGHGLVTGEIARETWTIRDGDPLSARAEIHWTETLERDGWSVRTETFSSLSCDETSFLVRARIEAYEGERLIHARDHEARIPRVMI
ncbi:CocE/NonD family hydrolase [Benzoatithermus flavus]|uniref:CocE/NonD family hydrolase n=1 Tax=Benzoatithermus flavus TaxID=3108223 RepID=A0ABU8XSE6_9PROT